ncbi:hypothetical protein FQN60_006964 [Etheostoma spectabile]|uniref:Uncharacterized protein n=1 Tax=Etheostoma spectabile TaxID=54343 RepID=A0A5J5CI15_9PERO|nr:hypothetical protein FQN60_006964 [Etheostoma spectabile]
MRPVLNQSSLYAQSQSGLNYHCAGGCEKRQSGGTKTCSPKPLAQPSQDHTGTDSYTLNVSAFVDLQTSIASMSTEGAIYCEKESSNESSQLLFHTQNQRTTPTMR